MMNRFSLPQAFGLNAKSDTPASKETGNAIGPIDIGHKKGHLIQVAFCCDISLV